MLDFIAYLSAQRRTGDLARGALPDSPVIPDPVPSRPVHLGDAVRRRLSGALRRLADGLEPVPDGRGVAAAGCR